MTKQHSQGPGRTARALCGALAAAFLIASAGPAWSWQTAHGRPDNSGFVDVQTLAARVPVASIPRLGGIAPGAGPVIATDGTVYVVNGRGKLMSFRPDGTPGWSRDIAGSQGVLSSPVLGTDGSIYVVGAATVRDHTTNPPTKKQVAELHKFNSGGAYLWHVPLPGAAGGLTTSAPPNIWKIPGQPDVILIPTVRKFGGFVVQLAALSETGAVLAVQEVTSFVPEITASSDVEWWEMPCYLITLGHGCGSFGAPGPNAPDKLHGLPLDVKVPFPAVAVFPPNARDVPLVLMSDGFRDLVGYFFNGSSFQERFRVHDDKRAMLSPPVAWPDGHAMLSTGGSGTAPEMMFAGLGMSTARAAGPLSMAAPTALGNSRYAVVHRFGGLSVMRGVTTEKSIAFPRDSIASAAASRGHIFVSTASGLHTFDKATLAELATFEWSNGGTSQPAIGPQGNIYAIANDTLFVFSATVGSQANGAPDGGPVLGGGVFQDSGIPATTPGKPIGGGIFQDSGIPAPASQTGGVFQAEEIPTSQPQQQNSYQQPMSKNGHRLFACLELDGDDCGKQDHREIAKQYCAKEGYSAAQKYDVETRKVKAETLTGDEYCSKKKCKVFEEITCTM